MNPATTPPASNKTTSPKKARPSLGMSTPATAAAINPQEMARAKTVVKVVTGLFIRKQ